MPEDQTNTHLPNENVSHHFDARSLGDFIQEASDLDNYWFEGSGISKTDLSRFLQAYPDNGIALFEREQFRGFATFEIVDSGKLPTDYVGKVPYEGKYLFIHQFTTDQNYSGDMKADEALLSELEKRAKAQQCAFIAEALSVNHPFSVERSLEERKVRHDAFGFYQHQQYERHEDLGWRWQSGNYPPEECVLYTKVFPQGT